MKGRLGEMESIKKFKLSFTIQRWPTPPFRQSQMPSTLFRIFSAERPAAVVKGQGTVCVFVQQARRLAF